LSRPRKLISRNHLSLPLRQNPQQIRLGAGKSDLFQVWFFYKFRSPKGKTVVSPFPFQGGWERSSDAQKEFLGQPGFSKVVTNARQPGLSKKVGRTVDDKIHCRGIPAQLGYRKVLRRGKDDGIPWSREKRRGTLNVCPLRNGRPNKLGLVILADKKKIQLLLLPACCGTTAPASWAFILAFKSSRRRSAPTFPPSNSLNCFSRLAEPLRSSSSTAALASASI